MNFPRKIWWLLPAVCLLVGALAGVVLRQFTGIAWADAMKQAAVLATVCGFDAALLLILISTYPTKVGILVYAITIGLAAGIFGAWLHSGLSDWIIASTDHGQPVLYKHLVAAIRWMIYPLLIVMFSITLALYRQMHEMAERYNLQQDAASLLKEAELFKLRQQLQPHFLYNSLNAISALVITSPSQAGEMIGRLSDFLRSSVKQGKTELVALDEELGFLRNYLWIETVRFGDRLLVDWSVAEDVLATKMPPFLLQPIMENAIRFGVYGKPGDVVISIAILLDAGMLKITITNPFDATMKANSGTGFGLSSIRRRLYLMYARQDLLITSTHDGSFTTTLLIPQ